MINLEFEFIQNLHLTQACILGKHQTRAITTRQFKQTSLPDVLQARKSKTKRKVQSNFERNNF